MEEPESEEEGKRRQKDVEGLKRPARQSVKQKLKMEIGYIRYRVANQLASSNPSLKLDDQRLSDILSTLNTPTHPPYASMINSAIAEMNEGGTSESGISVFIAKTYESLPLAHEAILKHHLRILCERREVVCTDDKLYILSDSKAEALKPKPGKRKRGQERGIGVGGPSKSKNKRKNSDGEENQLLALVSQGVIKAVEDQPETGMKLGNRVLSEAADNAGLYSNKGAKEVMEGKQLVISTEESEPDYAQTELRENQLQLEAAEPSGKSQEQVKPGKSMNPSLSKQLKPNIQAEIQRRKLRSYSRHNAESESERKENQLMVLESEGVIEASDDDQSWRASTKSSNQAPNLNKSAKEQAKQLAIRSKETEHSENELQLQTAEQRGKSQQGVKPAKSKKPSLSQPNIQSETQRRKLRSCSQHGAESDALPAHQAKHQEEEKKEELSLSRPLPRRTTLRSHSKVPPVPEPSLKIVLALSIVLSEDEPKAETPLAFSNPPRKKRGRPRKVNAPMPLALPPPLRHRGQGRPRTAKPEENSEEGAELASTVLPVKRRGRGRPRRATSENGMMPLAIFRPGSDDDQNDH